VEIKKLQKEESCSWRLESLGWHWWRETGSSLQRQNEAYWK